jgi:hemolysin III
MAASLTKPILRGHLHQAAFFAALGACTLLIASSPDGTTLAASSVYSFGLLFLFGFSAIYHRPHWQPKERAILKRIDHSAIFLLIAGTTTPIALLALPEQAGEKLLWVIWSAALVGVAQSVFWVSAPKWVTAVLCIGVGWLSLPFLDLIVQKLTIVEVLLLVVGGIFYSVGAVFYAVKRPNFFPGIFGYHELFHLFTIVAAIFHFIVIYNLIGIGVTI